MSDTPAGRLLRDINPEERPREKAMKHGFGALTNSELLALILRTGTIQCSITDICRQLFDSVDNSFSRLMRKSHKELTLIPGIGDVKAQQILAIMELVRRFSEEQIKSRPNVIQCSKDIYEILKYEIGNKTQEEIWMLSLNRRNSVIGRHAITRGSATASVFDPKLILKKALLDEAEGIVLAHNHPSGNLRPSPQDDAITRTLKNAAATMNIRMLDHLIVTGIGYYSYADEGRL
ncbi:MAG: DNA repair protein RadC [Muribaculaceae bacterium]|nr:DNA repair protein RadC [Muribaculaceae bacterium]